MGCKGEDGCKVEGGCNPLTIHPPGEDLCNPLTLPPLAVGSVVAFRTVYRHKLVRVMRRAETSGDWP